MGNQTLSKKIKSDEENWNEFFSRLAYAEKAAAEQCAIISDLLKEQGQIALAGQYKKFAAEEENHFRLVSKICKPLNAAPKAANRIYSGALMNKTANPIERMATIHLVFEPAALAFLGFFHANANKLVEDEAWAEDIKQSFREILQDEVGHVYSGIPMIKSLLRFASPEEIKITKQAMRRHRAFIIAGIKEMFKNSSKKQFLKSMLSRFDMNFARATEGVFV